MTPDEADALAGEYVLGTLSARERDAFERALARDAALAAVVAAWELRLAPLALATPDVTPDPSLWARITAALPGVDDGGRIADATIADRPVVDLQDWHRLRRALDRWRAAAITAGAIAAGLTVAIALQSVVKPTRAPEQYVAVVNRGGNEPAMIVRVDLTSRTVTLRPVAAEAPAGQSLELWYIGPSQQPKSLGVLTGDTKRLPIPAVFNGSDEVVARSTFAITVEPQGGSPAGTPTGPVIYSGQLLRE
jgi:anti-sigma-K factor RskA